MAWWTIVLLCVISVVQSQLSTRVDFKGVKKYSKKEEKKDYYPKPHHKDVEEFVKKLEYDVTLHEGSNPLLYGLEPVDLNLLKDGQLARDIADGVEEEIEIIDQEFGDVEIISDAAPSTYKSKPGPVAIMHQGIYSPSEEHNSLVDSWVVNIKEDLLKREMDPLYFSVHDRGIVRHLKRQYPLDIAKKDHNQNGFNLTSYQRQNGDTVRPVGVGVMKGLHKLTRFGNAESRMNGTAVLIRSHFFFGPLKIDLIFGSTDGIHILNTTLSSLAAHALIRIDEAENKPTFGEFLIDNPMEYEVRLLGSRNERFRRLSQSAITRLFKRGRRMETRLQRSFVRGLKKRIETPEETTRNPRKNKNKSSKLNKSKENI